MFKNKILQIAQDVFPKGIAKENPVIQQSDGWSCGMQAIENIEVLSSPIINDIQNFVVSGRLPKRAEDVMKSIFNEKYVEYAQAAKYKLEAALTPAGYVALKVATEALSQEEGWLTHALMSTEHFYTRLN